MHKRNEKKNAPMNGSGTPTGGHDVHCRKLPSDAKMTALREAGLSSGSAALALRCNDHDGAVIGVPLGAAIFIERLVTDAGQREVGGGVGCTARTSPWCAGIPSGGALMPQPSRAVIIDLACAALSRDANI